MAVKRVLRFCPTDHEGAKPANDAYRHAPRSARSQHPWNDKKPDRDRPVPAMACACDTKEPASLLHRADAALYRAKAEGRNRVVVQRKRSLDSAKA